MSSTAFSLSDCCITLLLDRSYVPGAQALLSSFRHSQILPDLPLIIISDDQDVLDDPILARAAHRRLLLSDVFIERYAELPKGVVPSKHQRDRVPKYTWFKFAAYQDLGFRSNLFIDSDMLFLRSPDAILRELEGKAFDYAACPTRGSANFEDVTPESFRARWDDIDKSLSPGRIASMAKRPVRFNSGLFVAQGRLFEPSYIARLFEIAMTTDTHYEQSMNHRAMRELATTFYELPIYLNITRPIYDLAVRGNCPDIAERVIVQHYTFGKPWLSRKDLPSDALWHQEYARIAHVAERVAA